jgi:hypothetical protein
VTVVKSIVRKLGMASRELAVAVSCMVECLRVWLGGAQE